MMELRLTLVDSEATIRDKITNAFRLHLNSVFKRAQSGIQGKIGDVCESLIERSLEYKSLLHGDLLGELGIPDVDDRLDSILKTIKESCEVNFTPLMKAGGELSGGLVIKMIRSDFMDILGLPESAFTTEKGTDIPWLDWLLLQGTRIIVIGYDVKLNLTPQEQRRSRTKLGLMLPGSGWRVPPEFSGTLEDNFITRAFNPSEVEKLLLKIVQEEIESRL